MSISMANVSSSWILHKPMMQVPRSPAPLPICARAPQGATLRRVLQATLQADLVGGASAGARRALQKLAAGCQALALSSTLETALAKILAEQSKQRDQRSTLAQQTVKLKMDQRTQQTLAQMAKIQQRIEAERNASIWDKLVTFFKGVAAAFSAASSLFTGPAGMTGAALLVSSMIIAHAIPGEAGKWLSLGLSLAGALFTAGATLWSDTAQGGTKLIKFALTIGKSLSSGASGGCSIVRGCYEHSALQAEAELALLQTLSQKLLTEAEEEREELKLLAEAQDRGVQIVAKVIQTQHEVTLSAIRGGEK